MVRVEQVYGLVAVNLALLIIVGSVLGFFVVFLQDSSTPEGCGASVGCSLLFVFCCCSFVLSDRWLLQQSLMVVTVMAAPMSETGGVCSAFLFD